MVHTNTQTHHNAASTALIVAVCLTMLTEVMHRGAASMEFPDMGSRQLDGWASGDLNDGLREQAEQERLAQRPIGCSLPGELHLAAFCGYSVEALRRPPS
jgi:hypothetical protein